MGTPGSLEEKQIKPSRWMNWVPALAVHQPQVGVCSALAGGSVGCDLQALPG